MVVRSCDKFYVRGLHYSFTVKHWAFSVWLLDIYIKQNTKRLGLFQFVNLQFQVSTRVAKSLLQINSFTLKILSYHIQVNVFFMFTM